MPEIKTFKVPRGIAGGTKKLDKKVAELQSAGWTIRDIKQPTTLNPNFYVEAERGADTQAIVEDSAPSGEMGTLIQNVVWLRDDIGVLQTKLDDVVGLLREIRDRR